MKLVEILARELKEWPRTEVLYLSQAQDGDLVLDFCDPVSDVPGDWEHLGKCFDRASDWIDAKVTIDQWESERARILLESQPERDPLIREITSSASVGYQLERDFESEEVNKYEQELWDKVASSAIGGIVASNAFHNYSNFQGNVANAVDFASQVADAFMAERAKRVGK